MAELTPQEREDLCLRQSCDRRYVDEKFYTVHSQVCDDFAARVEELVGTRVYAELDRIALKWQTGHWANVPRGPTLIQERIGGAQFVTDWLRAEADAWKDLLTER